MKILDRWRARREGRLCMETQRRVHEIIDSELPPGRKREQLEAHLRACITCAAGAESWRQLKDAVARVGREPDPAVKRRLVGLIEAIREGDVPGDPGGSPPA